MTLTSGIVFTFTQVPIYRAVSTYVVVPRASTDDNSGYTYKLDTLAARSEIANTFAEIALSTKVKNDALASISLASGRDYVVSNKLRAGTNVLEFAVEGPDPVVAKELSNAIGKAIEKYVDGLYEIFTLISLDEATIPVDPVSPNKSLNLSLAAVCGLVLGVGLAFLSQYLQTPILESLGVNIIDEQTGVYNKEYFSQRLNEEMVRAKRNRYPLSLALMRIDNLALLKGAESAKTRAELLRQVAILTNQYLREEDIVAYLENDTFSLLLPDMTGENAKALMEYLQTRIAWTPFEASAGIKFNLSGVIGVAAYSHNGVSRDELLANARRALDLASVQEDGKAFLIIPSNPSQEDSRF